MTTSLRTRALAVISAATLLTLGFGVTPAAAIGTPIITGTVTNGASPVEGLVIQAQPDVFGDPFIVDTTAADGTYHLDDVPDGSYQVAIFDAADDWMNVSSVAVTISSGNPTAVVNFALTPWPVGTSTVHGVITDSASGDPIDAAPVNFAGFGTARDDAVTTGPDGAYSFSQIPAGLYGLTINVPGYVNKFVTFTLDDDDDLTLDVQVTAANATISGTITDTSLNPVPDGLFVRYSLDADHNVNGNTMTVGGGYSFANIGAGAYTISVGGPGTDWMATSQAVTAVASTTVTADFELEPRIASDISGTIWNSDHSATLAKICVTAYDSAGDAVGGGPMGGTSADGTYTVADLESGDYRLLFWDCKYDRVPAYALTFFGPSTSLAHATAITLAGGVDQTGKDIQLEVGGTIAGHINVQAAGGVVDFPSGRGMDATVFQFVDGDWEAVPDPSPFVGAGAVGDYQANGLPAGTYRVGFVDGITSGVRSYATEYWDDSPTIAGGSDVVVTSGATTGGIDATVRIPRPGDAPAAVATADLTPAEEGGIDSAAQAAQGETLDVQVDPSLAGEWISVWGHSTPVLLGDWVQVSPTGVVTVPVSTSMPTGAHQLVAQDAEGNVLGWTPIQIAAGAAASGLASTGSPITNVIAPLGATLLLLAAGTVLMLVRRRRA
ncbi:MAG: carboxypeptidase regulatory-like domain-containing protein [Rhodoglobus sp.]